MKTIIYIGDFTIFYSTEVYIADALESIGYNVVRINERSFSLFTANEVIKDILGLKPILVLFSKGRPIGDSERFIEELRRLKINTACWLFDLYFDLPVDRKWKLESKIAPFNSDIIYSTDGGHDKNFEAIGIKHKLLRQGIHEPDAILYDREKTHEVIFVGGDVYRNRILMLEDLHRKYGNRFEWLGREKQIRGLALNELYASTKIVVGDSQPSPLYWSNRIYETLGRGGFLLHPKVEGLETEFIDGVHYVSYERGNSDALIKKIEYYLEHEDEREKIRKAGFEHVKNNYTYRHRCIELMKNYD